MGKIAKISRGIQLLLRQSFHAVAMCVKCVHQCPLFDWSNLDKAFDYSRKSLVFAYLVFLVIGLILSVPAVANWILPESPPRGLRLYALSIASLLTGLAIYYVRRPPYERESHESGLSLPWSRLACSICIFCMLAIYCLNTAPTLTLGLLYVISGHRAAAEEWSQAKEPWRPDNVAVVDTCLTPVPSLEASDPIRNPSFRILKDSQILDLSEWNREDSGPVTFARSLEVELLEPADLFIISTASSGDVEFREPNGSQGQISSIKMAPLMGSEQEVKIRYRIEFNTSHMAVGDKKHFRLATTIYGGFDGAEDWYWDKIVRDETKSFELWFKAPHETGFESVDYLQGISDDCTDQAATMRTQPFDNMIRKPITEMNGFGEPYELLHVLVRDPDPIPSTYRVTWKWR